MSHNSSLSGEPPPSPCVHCGQTFRRCHHKEDNLNKTVASTEIVVGQENSHTRLIKKINGGSYGDIYHGKMLQSNKTVAVKIERQRSNQPNLLTEGNVYRNLCGGPGVPIMHWYGLYGQDYHCMIMELLGPSLQDLFVQCNRKLSLKTVLHLIDQMVETIEFVHEHGYVHRDISASNFMIGRGESSTRVYLIDYGLATKFVTGIRFLPASCNYRLARSMVGTPRFASINAHKGQKEGRRDDMESLGYVWIYFLKGSLPWQGLPSNTVHQKITRIQHSKVTTPVADLCTGLPKEFLTYMQYCRRLKQYDIPDYGEIRRMFRNLAKDRSIQYDMVTDWVEQNEIDNDTEMGRERQDSANTPSKTSPVSH